MDAWLRRAPWWAVGALMGALVLPAFVLVLRVAGDQSWPAALITGLVTAALCGPVMGALVASRLRGEATAAGGLQPSDLAAADRASRRGAVPADPALRRAALRLLEHRLAAVRAARTRGLVVTAGAGAVVAYWALTQAAWWWVALVGLVLLQLGSLLLPRRLERRAEQLRGGSPG